MEELTLNIDNKPLEDNDVNYNDPLSKQSYTFKCKNCGALVTIHTDKKCSNLEKEKLHFCYSGKPALINKLK